MMEMNPVPARTADFLQKRQKSGWKERMQKSLAEFRKNRIRCEDKRVLYEAKGMPEGAKLYCSFALGKTDADTALLAREAAKGLAASLRCNAGYRKELARLQEKSGKPVPLKAVRIWLYASRSGVVHPRLSQRDERRLKKDVPQADLYDTVCVFIGDDWKESRDFEVRALGQFLRHRSQPELLRMLAPLGGCTF